MEATTSWLDVHDIAANLGVSADWVRRQCHNGTIPATKFGRTWRIDARDYETFTRKYRGGATPPSRQTTAAKRSKRRVG